MPTASRPLLARFAIPRSEGDPLPGFYSNESDVWLIETTQGLEPLITARPAQSELVTKTKVQREQDDQDWYSSVRETVTKTEQRPERDDPESSFLALELITKTDVKRERDD